MSEGLSVIVCAFNARERVTRFIAPLRRVVGQLDFAAELVVVDDGSADGTLDALRALGKNVRVVEHGRNRGPSVARNTGILAARHEWLMFCDDDVEIDVETLANLWNRPGVCVLIPTCGIPKGACRMPPQRHGAVEI